MKPKRNRLPRPTFQFRTVLREARMLYGMNIKVAFPLAFIFSLVRQFASFYVQRNMVATNDHELALTNPLGMVLAVLATLTVSIVLAAVIQRHAYNAYQLKKLSVKQTWHAVLRLIPRLLIVGVFTYFLSALGVALYVFPGLVIFALLFLAQPLVLFQQLTALRAIKASVQVCFEHFSKVMLVVVFYLLILYLPNIFIEFFITSASSNMLFGLDEVVAIFINALIFPLLCILPVVVYHAIDEIKQKQHGSKASAS